MIFRSKQTRFLLLSFFVLGAEAVATVDPEDCPKDYGRLANPDDTQSQADYLDQLLKQQPAAKTEPKKEPAEEEEETRSLAEIFGWKEPDQPHQPAAADQHNSGSISQIEFLKELLQQQPAAKTRPKKEKESAEEEEETRSLAEIFGLEPAVKPEPRYDPAGPINPRNFPAPGSGEVDPFATGLTPWLGAGGRFGYSFTEPPRGGGWENYGSAIPGALANGTKLNYPFGSQGEVSRLNFFWKSVADGKIKLLASHEGRLHKSGTFTAPVAVMFDPSRNEYILAQAGNFQFLDRESQPLLESQGKLILHRGVHHQSTVTIPQIAATDLARDAYLRLRGLRNWYVQSHTDLAFSFPYAGTGRAETNHVTLPIEKLRDFESFATPWVHSPYTSAALDKIDVLPNDNGNRYTSDKSIAALRFGPNVLSIATPVTNVRFTSAWNSEKEFQLIEPENLDWLPESQNVKVAFAALTIAGPAQSKAKEKVKVKVKSQSSSRSAHD